MTTPGDQPLRSDFEHLSNAVQHLTRTLEGFPVQMAATYVRQDVYAAHQELHRKVHQELEGDLVDLHEAIKADIANLHGAYTKDMTGLKQSVEELKGSNQWIWRTLVATVLPVVVNAIVVAIVLTATGGR